MAQGRQADVERVAVALEDIAAALWVANAMGSPGVNGGTWGNALELTAGAIRRLMERRGQQP